MPLRALLVTLALADCGDAHAADFSGFLEDLSRDLHHEDELRLWEAIAASYTLATQTFELDTAGKGALYRLLLAASFGKAEKDAIESLTPRIAGPVLDHFQQLRSGVHRDAVIGVGGLKGYIRAPDDDERSDEFTAGHNFEES